MGLQIVYIGDAVGPRQKINTTSSILRLHTQRLWQALLVRCNNPVAYDPYCCRFSTVPVLVVNCWCKLAARSDCTQKDLILGVTDNRI